MTLVISKQTQRRFILGKQGLYPGRRWAGKDGIVQAIRSGCPIQIDPLNIGARSHDITLYGRVVDYHPQDLLDLMYQDRAFFDYGGTVMVHPIEELPYWRQIMNRHANWPRWAQFAHDFEETIAFVLSRVREHGPTLMRDFPNVPSKTGKFQSYRSGKDAGKALYYLWMIGELMTYGRQGVFDRIYDLRERIAPQEYDRVATIEETARFFALKLFHEHNIFSLKRWQGEFASIMQKRVSFIETAAELDALLAEGLITRIEIEGDSKNIHFVLTSDIPLLEMLEAGHIPDDWLPIDTTTDQEVTILAPLEIVSARGRALPLFDFEYLWEVYKPEQTRRWGYYTLPILYGDRLVARLDPKLDRKTNTLIIKGYWHEEGMLFNDAYAAALTAGLKRFMRLIGAKTLDVSALPENFRNIG